jgi:hypothetical protein
MADTDARSRPRRGSDDEPGSDPSGESEPAGGGGGVQTPAPRPFEPEVPAEHAARPEGLLLRLAPWLAIAGAAVSIAAPILALPVVLLVVFTAVAGPPSRRKLVALLGGALALGGLGRFLVVYAMPSIVGMGTHATGERAASVLREIVWAERKALELGLVDRDRDGAAEALLLGDLTGHARVPRVDAPLLRPELYVPMKAAGDDAESSVFQVGGYAFVVYLPGASEPAVRLERAGVDAARARRSFVAYAWPAERPGGFEAAKRERVFMVDQDETVCEAQNELGYLGLDRVPSWDAALAEPSWDAGRCAGKGRDGLSWRRWKRRR